MVTIRPRDIEAGVAIPKVEARPYPQETKGGFARGPAPCVIFWDFETTLLQRLVWPGLPSLSSSRGLSFRLVVFS